MVFLFAKGDTYEGSYDYYFASSADPNFKKIADRLRFVVQDVVVSIEDRCTKKQNLLIELSFSDFTETTLAVGYYNSTTALGKLLEMPKLDLSESLGQTDFQVTKHGSQLNIDFIEVDRINSTTENLSVYSAILRKVQ